MFLIFGLAIGVLVASVILRSACWIYNHLGGTHPKDYSSARDFQPRQIMLPPHLAGQSAETPQNPFAQPVGFTPRPATPPQPEKPAEAQVINPYSSPKSIDAGAPPNYLPLGGDLNHPDGVPEPSWPLSFGIVVVTYLTNTLVGFIADVAFAQVFGMSATWGIFVPVMLARVVVNALLSSAILSVMLPAPYVRALLVVLIEAAVGLLIFGVIFGVIFVTAGGLRR